jgi:hypothetical protein
MVGVGRLVFQIVAGAFARAGFYPFFSFLVRCAISEHPDNVGGSDDNQITLLALSPEGFRRDLEVLAKSGRFRVLLLPSKWPYRIMYLFYPRGLRPTEYLNPPSDSKAMQQKQALQKFYLNWLPELLSSRGIDCVVSYHIRVPMDVDLGMAAMQAGIPYIVMYREGLFASGARLRERTMPVIFKRFGFWGTHLIVHNQSCRELAIETGLADADKVSALGCLRMDEFVRRLKDAPDRRGETRRRVAYFPFSLKDTPDASLPMDVFFPMFRDIHVSLARLAADNPELDVVFKPKPKVLKGWRVHLDKAFAEEGIDPDAIPNLIIDANLDAQNLILDSDVIVGLNTTTLLEAGIAKKPVIVTFFHEIRQKAYLDTVKFLEAFDYLDVADDSADMVRLIMERLLDAEISEEEMAGRRKMFAKYVSDPDGGALENYSHTIAHLVSKRPGATTVAGRA